MRLLIFLDTDHVSGPARLAIDFARRAMELGHEPLMLGLVRGPRRTPTVFTEAAEAAGLRVDLLHERFRFDPRVVGQFRRLLSAFRPDVYQSHGYKGSALGRVAQSAGVPWQAVFHGFTWENWKVRLYHRLDVRWLRRADEVITVSREFEERLRRGGVPAGRLHWVANAIDERRLLATDSGEDLRRSWLEGAPEGAVLVGVLGRFSPEKGPEIFIDAFARAASAEPRLHGVMVGDGPLLEGCRARAAGMGLDGRLRLPGFRSDIAAFYRAVDFLVIPSLSEGMPTVMIEAMLMGVPVVSTRVGAVPDILADGETGLLVERADAAALGRAMVRMASDDGLRRAIAGRAGRLARERLTLDRRTGTLLEHMERLARSRIRNPNEWRGSDR